MDLAAFFSWFSLHLSKTSKTCLLEKWWLPVCGYIWIKGQFLILYHSYDTNWKSLDNVPYWVRDLLFPAVKSFRLKGWQLVLSNASLASHCGLIQPCFPLFFNMGCAILHYRVITLNQPDFPGYAQFDYSANPSPPKVTGSGRCPKTQVTCSNNEATWGHRQGCKSMGREPSSHSLLLSGLNLRYLPMKPMFFLIYFYTLYFF